MDLPQDSASSESDHVPITPIDIELPLDIYELILKSFSCLRLADVNTLTICALVCRAWLPCCRRQLYRNIIFHTERQTLVFIDNTLTSPTASFAPYLRLVQSVSLLWEPAFDLLRTKPNELLEMLLEAGSKATISSTIFTMCAWRLNGVHELALSKINWTFDWQIAHTHPPTTHSLILCSTPWCFQASWTCTPSSPPSLR